MAQIRVQPKIHVCNLKLGRKSSVASMIEKLKPYLHQRCAEFLTNNVPEFELQQGGALWLNQLEMRENLTAGTTDKVMNIWQGRNALGSMAGLTMLGEAAIKDIDNLGDSTDKLCPCQLVKCAQEFEKIHPVLCSIGKLQTANLYEGTQHLLFASPFKLPLPQCAWVRPPPRRGHRIEIDLASFGKIFGQSMNVLSFNALLQSYQNVNYTPELSESNDLKLEQFDDDETTNSQIVNITGGQLNLGLCAQFWNRSKKDLIVFLTYLVIFCILGFAFTLLG